MVKYGYLFIILIQQLPATCLFNQFMLCPKGKGNLSTIQALWLWVLTKIYVEIISLFELQSIIKCAFA